MPTDAVEDLLSELNADGGEGGSDAEGSSDKKNPVRDLRKFAEQVLKEKKAADKRNQDLEKELSAFRADRERDLFASLGLDEKKQALFKAMNADKPVTAEGVQEFLSEYGLAGDPDEVVDAPAEGSNPVSTPGNAAAQTFRPSTPTEQAQPTSYSSDDLVKMIMRGEAAKAHEIVARATKNPNLITFKHADKMPA